MGSMRTIYYFIHHYNAFLPKGISLYIYYYQITNYLESFSRERQINRLYFY